MNYNYPLPLGAYCKTPQQWSEIFQQIGEKVVVKRRTGGYDGRGQWIIKQEKIPISSLKIGTNEVIVEKFIPFDYEIFRWLAPDFAMGNPFLSCHAQFTASWDFTL